MNSCRASWSVSHFCYCLELIRLGAAVLCLIRNCSWRVSRQPGSIEQTGTSAALWFLFWRAALVNLGRFLSQYLSGSGRIPSSFDVYLHVRASRTSPADVDLRLCSFHR